MLNKYLLKAKIIEKTDDLKSIRMTKLSMKKKLKKKKLKKMKLKKMQTILTSGLVYFKKLKDVKDHW